MGYELSDNIPCMNEYLFLLIPFQQLAVQQSGMEDDSPKEGGTSHNGPSIITEPITASATTTAHQLLQNTNPVLTVHPISSNDHLVAYAIE